MVQANENEIDPINGIKIQTRKILNELHTKSDPHKSLGKSKTYK